MATQFFHWLRCSGVLFSMVSRVDATHALYESLGGTEVMFSYVISETAGTSICDASGATATPILTDDVSLYPELCGFPSSLAFNTDTLLRIDAVIARDQMHVWPYRRGSGSGGMLYVYQWKDSLFDVFEACAGGGMQWLGAASSSL